MTYSYEDKFIARLLAKVDQYEDMEKCWIMQVNYDYPQIWYKDKIHIAFGLFHEYLFGPIKEGWVRDHKCENKRCINPNHVESVPKGINNLRGRDKTIGVKKDYCINGHTLTEENTIIIVRSSGFNQYNCRICRKKATRKYREKKGEAYR